MVYVVFFNGFFLFVSGLIFIIVIKALQWPALKV